MSNVQRPRRLRLNGRRRLRRNGLLILPAASAVTSEVRKRLRLQRNARQRSAKADPPGRRRARSEKTRTKIVRKSADAGAGTASPLRFNVRGD
jgi:hypothetical protein